MHKMKKYIIWTLFFSSFTTISFSQELSYTPEQIDRIMNQIVTTYQKKIPFQVDEITELSSLSYDNKTVKYGYTMINKLDQFDKSIVYKTIQKMTCNPLGKTHTLVKEYDISYEYSYYDKENNLLTNFVIDKSQCQ